MANVILATGEKTGNADTAVALVAASTPCRRVYLQPRYADTGAVQNTKPVEIMISGSTKGWQLLPAGSPIVLEVEDAMTVLIKPKVNGEGVRFIVTG